MDGLGGLTFTNVFLVVLSFGWPYYTVSSTTSIIAQHSTAMYICFASSLLLSF